MHSDSIPDTLPEAPLRDDAAPLAAPAALLAVAGSALLSACGGGGGGSGADASTPVIAGRSISIDTTAYTQLNFSSDAQAARFLQQAQFSCTESEIAQARQIGPAAWIERQVATSSGVMGWDWLNAQGYGAIDSNNWYDSATPGDRMAWAQLMASPDAARKRMALALSEIVVVSLSGIDITWRSHAIAKYWDTLCTHAFGNYRDLLQDITLNVAMGYYLNTKGNRKEDAASGRQPDENYAREVMQLFTVGLQKLNADGTLLGGTVQETYTADDVSNLARVFTGYDIDQTKNAPTVVAQTGGGTRTIPSTDYVRLPLKLTTNTTNSSAANHSTLAVNFLGTTIPANTDPATALRTALDTLFNHANTAPFLCKQLIQRLVTSNPSAAYVGRVAAKFANNGSGVRGDLAQVYAAILLDDEARGSAGLTDPEYGKLREPMVRLVQWVRTFGVASASGTWKIGDLSNPGSSLGQSPLRSPSVFNFFRPGYVPPATTLSTGKVAPEFQIVNESSVGGYLNTMMNVISSGLNSGDIKAAYTAEIALATSPSSLVARLNLLLCAGQLSATTVTTITNTVASMAGTVASSATTATNLRNRVCAAVLLVMACPEYLVQK
ncbi:DUF1800 domain-containing protein [Curvibacter sp. APW13]|uniref:DUF1800 domain-containing protein n=1 Tax=Curvibacter sp. APW13 TaxID=3077236 RepID=UPI0028DE8027|nr:DUF1800 domain-containing protein [Curvibacter sp. APW13]MDT8990070.1 DUF1800 domain-containing protein [Curvibacter sp. APW13]